MHDAAFLRFAAQAGVEEIAAAKLAIDRTGSDAVRYYAQLLVKDHTLQVGEVRALAADLDVAVPSSPSPAAKQDLDDLARLKGDAFDHAFLDMQAEGHVKVFDEFAREARHGHDGCVRGWAARYLPALGDHLRLADQLLVLDFPKG